MSDAPPIAVGTVHVECPECEEVIPIPVTATISTGDTQVLNLEPDMADLWAPRMDTQRRRSAMSDWWPVSAERLREIMREALYSALGDFVAERLRILDLARKGVITTDEAKDVIEAAYAGGVFGVGGAYQLTAWARDQIQLGRPVANILDDLKDPAKVMLEGIL